MKMIKNCDGKKIDTCKDCNQFYITKTKLFNRIPAGKAKCKNFKIGKNDYAVLYAYMKDDIVFEKIPKWCPLEDYKEANHEKPA